MHTLEELKVLLSYTPLTGNFHWTAKGASAPKSRVHVGDVAGSLYNSTGYIVIGVLGKRYLAHRLAWFFSYGEWPHKVDHKDRDTQNNRLDNLRLATQQQNGFNRGLQQNNISGIKGVCWVPSRQRWKAYGWLNGKGIHLGMFIHKADAVSKRRLFEQQHHGEYAAAQGGL